MFAVEVLVVAAITGNPVLQYSTFTLTSIVVLTHRVNFLRAVSFYARWFSQSSQTIQDKMAKVS